MDESRTDPPAGAVFALNMLVNTRAGDTYTEAEMGDWLRDALEIDTELRWASQIPDVSDDPSQRLVDLCLAAGADVYLAGADGRAYMDLEPFAEAGVEVMFQEFDPAPYDQLFGDFESHLSTLDLVLNCGPKSLAILRQGRPA